MKLGSWRKESLGGLFKKKGGGRKRKRDAIIINNRDRWRIRCGEYASLGSAKKKAANQDGKVFFFFSGTEKDQGIIN